MLTFLSLTRSIRSKTPGNTLFALQSRVRFNHDEITSDTNDEISNRQKFRNVEPDMKVIDYLDSIRLGKCNRRSHRVAVARKFTELEKDKRYKKMIKERNEVPFPFGYPAVPLGQAKQWGHLPYTTGPNMTGSPPAEVALIGRSNVGKSSLLNRLCGFDDSFVQKSIVSDKPGETQALHFYGLGSKTLIDKYMRDISRSVRHPRKLGPAKTTRGSALVLVDMPGYGFSFMKDKDRQEMLKMMQSYLLYRPSLKRILLLLDGRHGFKIGDKEFLYELFGTLKDPDTVVQLFQDIKASNPLLNVTTGTDESQAPKIRWKIQVVLTKCDLVDRNDVARRIQMIEEQINEIMPGYGNMLPIMATSSMENKGLIDLKKHLAGLAVESDYTIAVENAEKEKASREARKAIAAAAAAAAGSSSPMDSTRFGGPPLSTTQNTIAEVLKVTNATKVKRMEDDAKRETEKRNERTRGGQKVFDKKDNKGDKYSNKNDSNPRKSKKELRLQNKFEREQEKYAGSDDSLGPRRIRRQDLQKKYAERNGLSTARFNRESKIFKDDDEGDEGDDSSTGSRPPKRDGGAGDNWKKERNFRGGKDGKRDFSKNFNRGNSRGGNRDVDGDSRGGKRDFKGGKRDFKDSKGGKRDFKDSRGGKRDFKDSRGGRSGSSNYDEDSNRGGNSYKGRGRGRSMSRSAPPPTDSNSE